MFCQKEDILKEIGENFFSMI